MDIQLILLEKIGKNSTFTTSGIMLDQQYIFTTSNIMYEDSTCNLNLPLNNLRAGILQSFQETKLSSISYRIIQLSSNRSSIVKNLKLLAHFQSKSIRNTSANSFRNWAIDSPSNTKDLTNFLSLFFFFTIGENGNISDLKKILAKWFNVIKDEKIFQTDEILVNSIPFGNHNFFGCYSKGIVSNIIGNNGCLILSDCPSCPGSEGAPVYKYNEKRVPFGIVLSCLCWFTGNWTGLTLIADLRIIIFEILNEHIQSEKLSIISTFPGVVFEVPQTIVFGDRTQMLFTSEIMYSQTNLENINLFLKNRVIPAKLIYKTPDNEEFDIAIIKCNPTILKSLNLNAIKPSMGNENLCDSVYAVGFAVFSKESKYNPTVSKGIICHIDKSMIKTTCCVNPGMSGGGILNLNGELVGIIVSNIKLQGNNSVYPRLNMIIPFQAIFQIIENYLITGDQSILTQLHIDDQNVFKAWRVVQSKL